MGDITVTAAQVALVDVGSAEVFNKVANATITAGQVLYPVAASGKVGLADEDADAEHSVVEGIALTGGGAGQAISVLRRGRISGYTLSGMNYGAWAYLSTTAGALATTGSVAYGRVEALSDSDATKVLYFDATGITVTS